MQFTRRHFIAATSAGIGLPHAWAQEKDLRIVVPVGPGGPMDMLARNIAEELGQTLKRTVLVDNRGGAAGQIAATAVARAAGDPGMLLLGSMGIMAVSPHLYPNLPYDVRQDFTPVSQIASVPHALVVNPSAVPATTMQEFMQWARAQKAPIPYASYGSGSVSHIAAEMFRNATSIPMVQVPYRDAPRVAGDLIKGDVPLIFDTPSAYADFAKEGRLRILAVTSKAPSAAFPELPTMDKSGFTGFDIANWYALYLPRNAPPATVQQLRTALKPIIEAKKLKDRFLPLGFEPTTGDQASFAAFHESEIRRWQDFTRKNDIKIST